MCRVTSTDRIASEPYVSMNGNSFAAVFLVIQREHKTLGSSSAHLPLASSSFFCKPCKITLLVASACPFVCACATAVNRA